MKLAGTFEWTGIETEFGRIELFVSKIKGLGPVLARDEKPFVHCDGIYRSGEARATQNHKEHRFFVGLRKALLHAISSVADVAGVTIMEAHAGAALEARLSLCGSGEPICPIPMVFGFS